MNIEYYWNPSGAIKSLGKNNDLIWPLIDGNYRGIQDLSMRHLNTDIFVKTHIMLKSVGNYTEAPSKVMVPEITIFIRYTPQEGDKIKQYLTECALLSRDFVNVKGEFIYRKTADAYLQSDPLTRLLQCKQYFARIHPMPKAAALCNYPSDQHSYVPSNVHYLDGDVEFGQNHSMLDDLPKLHHVVSEVRNVVKTFTLKK